MASDPWEWTETIQESVAKVARDLLEEIVAALDQKLPRIEVSAYGPDAPPSIPIGAGSTWLRIRMNAANMLIEHRILHRADFDGRDAILIAADEEMTREAYRRLENRVDPRAASNRAKVTKPTGTEVFIGHGRSPLWRELRDFLERRLGLKCSEFNSVTPAGIATSERLSELLGNAGFAFLVLTAEDVHEDGKRHARENVIHEAGLFQGRLGFRKAIVVLENECEEFSNIHGLGQIRFTGTPLEKSEEIREVLEREGML